MVPDLHQLIVSEVSLKPWVGWSNELPFPE